MAIRVLQQDGTIARAAVIDVDVHQGNGTAFTFEGDPTVFTFSIHQEQLPGREAGGSLDVGLADGTGDHDYLQRLEQALPQVLAARPDLVFYVAGADPYTGDQLGGLNLTFEGLRGRDYVVSPPPATWASPWPSSSPAVTHGAPRTRPPSTPPRSPKPPASARDAPALLLSVRSRGRLAEAGRSRLPRVSAGYASWPSGQLRRSRNVIGSIRLPCGNLRASRRAAHSTTGPATRSTHRVK